MLTITVLGDEYYDEVTEEFITKNDVVLHLEHSLVSLSKWESKWEIPFLSSKNRTPEQLLNYIECMVSHPLSSSEVFQRLSNVNIESVNAYLESKQTATKIHEVKAATKTSETITAELIYYWMVSFRIPKEFETWNLNRLFTLIRICGLKNAKPKKMSPSEVAARNRQLNAQRRQELGTSG